MPEINHRGRKIHVRTITSTPPTSDVTDGRLYIVKFISRASHSCTVNPAGNTVWYKNSYPTIRLENYDSVSPPLAAWHEIRRPVGTRATITPRNRATGESKLDEGGAQIKNNREKHIAVSGSQSLRARCLGTMCHWSHHHHSCEDDTDIVLYAEQDLVLSPIDVCVFGFWLFLF